MNREMKRAQAKAERQQKAAGTDRRSAPAATTKRAAVQENEGGSEISDEPEEAGHGEDDSEPTLA